MSQVELSANPDLEDGTPKPDAVKQRRKSNLEVFRIVTMLLIVAHHYVVNSGLFDAGGPIFSDLLSWRSMFLLVFGAWGKIGINCFVLITGYFMCKSNITVRKFVKLLSEVLFYRIAVQCIFWLSGYEPFSLKGLAMILMPFGNVSDNFTSCFLVFFLLIPFLNILVNHMNEKQHILLLAWCGFTYVFLAAVPGIIVRMNYVSWFSVLYIISSYIRMYPHEIFQRKKLWGWLTVICLILDVISVIVCTWIGVKTDEFLSYCFVMDSNAVLAVITGVCAFLCFRNLRMKYNPVINRIAASAFGVLLIHANGEAMRKWLWYDVVDCAGHYRDRFMPLYAIGCVLIIYTAATVIDQLRISLIETPFFRFWDKHWEKVLPKYREWESKLALQLSVGKTAEKTEE